MKKRPNILEIKPLGTSGKSDERFDIFVAGSIENGKAIEWQKHFKEELEKMRPKYAVGLFNPRRDNWDPTWGEDEANPELIKQIEWELDHLEQADLIVMYLQPGTISPISLFELGLFAKEVYRAEKQMIVLCHGGFHRKTNVDVVCDYYDISVAKNMDDLIKKAKQRIKDHFAPKDKKLKMYKSTRETNPKKCAKMGGVCSCSLAEMGKYC